MFPCLVWVLAMVIEAAYLVSPPTPWNTLSNPKPCHLHWPPCNTHSRQWIKGKGGWKRRSIFYETFRFVLWSTSNTSPVSGTVSTASTQMKAASSLLSLPVAATPCQNSRWNIDTNDLKNSMNDSELGD